MSKRKARATTYATVAHELVQPDPEIAALVRMQNACIAVSAILDGGERDPTWHETQEFETAGLEYGRILRGKAL